MTGYDGIPYEIGDRVELHPGIDLWMFGARYGTDGPTKTLIFTPRHTAYADQERWTSPIGEFQGAL